MMEFKAGDKLRYIGAKSHYYTVGNVYELQEARSGAFWLTDNESSEDANHEWDFEGLEANFEHINEPQFKVGDKVRVVNVDGIQYGEEYYYNGFETEVFYISCDGDVHLLSTEGEEGVYINKREIANGVIELIESKPIESKPTKKQRIAALEKTVASLTEQFRALQQQVNERFEPFEPFEPSTVGVAVDGDTAEAIEETPVKTANELRAEVIEKAKEFIEKCKPPFGRYRVRSSIFFPNYNYCDCEFIVNTEKRTVVALLKGINSGDVRARGIAKCYPNDVFNEHIGKAIALGRALGLDVSEFENAVQPTDVVVGMLIRYTFESFNVEVVRSHESVLDTRAHTSLSIAANNKDVLIVDDTNAEYEVNE